MSEITLHVITIDKSKLSEMDRLYFEGVERINREVELGYALDNYMDPDHPEFDLSFALEAIAADKSRAESQRWFTPEEVDRVHKIRDAN